MVKVVLEFLPYCQKRQGSRRNLQLKQLIPNKIL